MNRKFLGDAFDDWKGSIIQRLSSEGLLKNLAVEPMITDKQPWAEKELSTYSRLLNLWDIHLILHRTQVFAGNRMEYFKSIGHRGDLFLDPDTGITTGKTSHKHITASELKNLLESDTTRSRLLLVYQHAAHGSFQDRVESIAQHVFRRIQNLCCTTYECGTVAMLFFSFHKGRIVAIKRFFDDLLGNGDNGRVRIWPNFRLS